MSIVPHKSWSLLPGDSAPQSGSGGPQPGLPQEDAGPHPIPQPEGAGPHPAPQPGGDSHQPDPQPEGADPRPDPQSEDAGLNPGPQSAGDVPRPSPQSGDTDLGASPQIDPEGDCLTVLDAGGPPVLFGEGRQHLYALSAGHHQETPRTVRNLASQKTKGVVRRSGVRLGGESVWTEGYFGDDC